MMTMVRQLTKLFVGYNITVYKQGITDNEQMRATVYNDITDN